MFAGFPSVYLLYTTSVLFDSFLLRAGKKTTLDLPSSAIVVLHLLLVALIDSRHSGIVGKKQKRLVNIPSTSLHFFLLSY